MAETFDAYEFGIRFRIESDDTEKKINEISNALNKVGVTFDDAFDPKGINDLMKGLTDAIGKLKNFDETLFALAGSLDSISHKFSALGGFLLGGFMRHAREGIFNAGQIEKGINKLQLMAKKKMPEMADTIYKEVMEAGLHTVQTTQQVTDLTFGMLTQKINPFTEELKNIQLTTGETVTAMETLSDVASIMPYGMGGLTMGIRQALGEGKLSRMRGLGARLDLGEEQLKRYNKALKKAKGPQEKFNALVKELAEDYGGLAKAQENSFAFIMMQLDDIRDKFHKTFFIDTGVLQMIADFLKEIQFYFIDLLESDKLEGLKESMKVIASTFLDIARRVFEGVKAVVEFVAANPQLMEMSVHLGLLASGAAMATGKLAGLLSVMANLLVVMTNMRALGIGKMFAKMAPIFAGGKLKGVLTIARAGFAALAGSLASIASTVAPILAIAAAIAAVVYGIAKWAVGGKDMADTWKRVQLVFKGLSEMISTLSDGTASMSAETAQALEEMGLLDLVVKLTEAWKKFSDFFVGFWDGISPELDYAWDAIVGMFESLATLTASILTMFASLFGLTGGVEENADGTADSWEKTGKIVGKIVGGLVFLVTMLADFVSIVADGWTSLMLAIVGIMEELYYQISRIPGMGGDEGQMRDYAQYRQSLQASLNASEEARNKRAAMNAEGFEPVPTKENTGITGKGKNAKMDEAKLAALLAAEIKKQPIVLNGRQLNEGLGDSVESEEERTN